MDVVDILQEQAVAICRELGELAGGEGVDLLEVTNLCNEVRLHIYSVERGLLPELRKLRLPDEVFRACENDHGELLEILDLIDPRDRENLGRNLNLLCQRLRVHFSSDRNLLLGGLRDLLSAEETDQLARKLETFRLREARNLPTPGAP